ncbi:MAG: GerAB/ArcD/ProY family transporter [Moorellales bacterium]
MRERELIDGRQATWLVIGLILPTAILVVPASTIKHAGHDAWLSIFLALPGGLAVAWMVVSLCRRFPEKDFFECAEEVLGRVPARVVEVSYVWWFLHTASLITLEFAAFLCAAILPDTPPLVFFVVGLAVVAYLVRLGPEVMGRYAQTVLPLTLLLLSVVLLLAVRDMEMCRLLPVFDRPFPLVLKGAAAPLAWFGEVVVFGLIIPHLNRPDEALRAAARGLLFTAFCLWASVTATIAVFGPALPAGWLFPTYNTVRVVSIANFLERLDAVVVAAWMFGGFIKVGMFYYAAALGSARILGIKDYRPLVLPVGAVIVALATLCRSVVELRDFAARVWPIYAFIPYGAGIPLLLLLVAVLRRGGKGS